MILGTRVIVDQRFTGRLRGMGFVTDTDGKINNLYIIERDEGHYDPNGGYVRYTVVCPEYIKKIE